MRVEVEFEALVETEGRGGEDVEVVHTLLIEAEAVEGPDGLSFGDFSIHCDVCQEHDWTSLWAHEKATAEDLLAAKFAKEVRLLREDLRRQLAEAISRLEELTQLDKALDLLDAASMFNGAEYVRANASKRAS